MQKLKKGLLNIYAILVEILAYLTCLIIYPFKFNKFDVLKGGKKPDILCVHGYVHNETPWQFFRYHLKKAGAGSVNTVFYHSIKESVNQNSLQVKLKMERFKELTGREIDVLIGHSLGGLVSLEYALQYAPKDKITYVITLGSPLHGTKMANGIGIGPNLNNMKENSDYLKSLHKRLQVATHLRLLCIASPVDLMIVPQSSAFMTELPYAENKEVPALGHMSFLFSKRVLKIIIEYLRQQHILKD